MDCLHYHPHPIPQTDVVPCLYELQGGSLTTAKAWDPLDIPAVSAGGDTILEMAALWARRTCPGLPSHSVDSSLYVSP